MNDFLCVETSMKKEHNLFSLVYFEHYWSPTMSENAIPSMSTYCLACRQHGNHIALEDEYSAGWTASKDTAVSSWRDVRMTMNIDSTNKFHGQFNYQQNYKPIVMKD